MENENQLEKLILDFFCFEKTIEELNEDTAGYLMAGVYISPSSILKLADDAYQIGKNEGDQAEFEKDICDFSLKNCGGK